MATLRQDLGPVTAYAYAVSEGYTGTEEEFAEVLANFADSAEQVAADAAQVALDKGAVHDDKEAVDSAEGRVTSAVNTFTTTTAPNAVTAVENAGTAQIGLVEAEGTRQIGLVADKGTEQVGTVSSEGTTQIGLVEAKGAEVIASIPGDYSTLQGDIASTYSSSSTYAVGDYVLYSGQLYRCTTDISTAEAWTSEKWTAVALGDDVSDLKSALTEDEGLFASIGVMDQNNLLLGKSFVRNKYYYEIEYKLATTRYCIVPVTSGTNYAFLGVRFISSVDTAKVNNMNYDTVVTWTADFTGDAYITVRNADFKTAFFCVAENYSAGDYGTIETPIYNSNTLAQTTGQSTKKPVSQKLFTDNKTEVEARLNSLESKIETHYAGNIFSLKTDVKDGYYYSIDTDNGNLVASSNSEFYGFIIKVYPQTTYSFTHGRFIVLLDEDKVPLAATGAYHYANVTSANSGNAIYMAVSFNKNTYPVADYVFSEGSLNPEPYKVFDAFTYPAPEGGIKLPFYKITGTLDGTNRLYKSTYRTELRKNARVLFKGDFSAFTSLTIGKRYSSSDYRYFVIDATNVSYYEKSTSTPVVEAHGLSISGTIKVIIEEQETNAIKITIYSNDGTDSDMSFQKTITGFVQNASSWFAQSGSAMTNCVLVWTSTDIKLPIWIFGDSYLQYSEERWTYYLHQFGYDKNCLLSGWPGESSVNGIIALEFLLLYGTPIYAIWAYGMNDDSDPGTNPDDPSDFWVTYRDRFIADCEANNVTPVFCTIPTVPGSNPPTTFLSHEKKNAWVRSSGYRYIDFAKAVGANSSGEWFDGMLSGDGVHPTAYGAEALFSQALIDFPELITGAK